MVMSMKSYPSPMGSILEFEHDLDELFGAVCQRPATMAPLPRIDVASFDDRTEILAEVPGVRKEDLNITVEGNALTLAGKRNAPPVVEGWAKREIRSGEFTRSMALPHPVDLESVSAELANGVLRIVLPKAEEVRPKSVEIK